MGDLSSFGGAGPERDRLLFVQLFGDGFEIHGTPQAEVRRRLPRHSRRRASLRPRTERTVSVPRFTNAENASGSAILGTGASLASLLLGLSVRRQRGHDRQPLGPGALLRGIRCRTISGSTPKLTLNFGLRYEYETGVSSPNNAYNPGFCTTCVNPLQSQVSSIPVLGVLEYAGQNGFSKTGGRTNADKFGPRVGFAWTVTPKTVIRGGYGSVLGTVFLWSSIRIWLHRDHQLCGES